MSIPQGTIIRGTFSFPRATKNPDGSWSGGGLCRLTRLDRTDANGVKFASHLLSLEGRLKGEDSEGNHVDCPASVTYSASAPTHGAADDALVALAGKVGLSDALPCGLDAISKPLPVHGGVSVLIRVARSVSGTGKFQSRGISDAHYAAAAAKGYVPTDTFDAGSRVEWESFGSPITNVRPSPAAEAPAEAPAADAVDAPLY